MWEMRTRVGAVVPVRGDEVPVRGAEELEIEKMGTRN